MPLFDGFKRKRRIKKLKEYVENNRLPEAGLIAPEMLYGYGLLQRDPERPVLPPEAQKTARELRLDPKGYVDLYGFGGEYGKLKSGPAPDAPRGEKKTDPCAPREDSGIRFQRSSGESVRFPFPMSYPLPPENEESLKAYLTGYVQRERSDDSFVDALLKHIDRSGKSDAEIYKAAGVDRRLFSKIVGNRAYTPSKDTCVCLALALRLNEKDADDLLSRAGFSFSRCVERDIILWFCFEQGICDVNVVNDLLFSMGQNTLGRIGK